jgi:hypothetical protein
VEASAPSFTSTTVPVVREPLATSSRSAAFIDDPITSNTGPARRMTAITIVWNTGWYTKLRGALAEL